jgi:hypothetical protein
VIAVYGPHSWFWHKAKKQFLDQIWCFFYNKSKILAILFIVKYEKITHFDEFLVLLGPIISSFFACLNEGKKWTRTTKGACSSPISMVTLDRGIKIVHSEPNLLWICYRDLWRFYRDLVNRLMDLIELWTNTKIKTKNSIRWRLFKIIDFFGP